MKTPREVILERHRSAETKLDEIRPEELAALARALAPPETVPVPTPQPSAGLRLMLPGFWHEAIWPWRRVWAGLAAAWLGILALNMTARLPSRPVGIELAKSQNPQVLAMLREQKKMLVQLLDPALPQTVAPAKTDGPRSEQRRELFIV